MLIRAANRQCDISTYSGYNLHGHSITRKHFTDADGYPVDGMSVEAGVHSYLHDTATQLERSGNDYWTLERLSMEAMRANLYGLASTAISKGRFTPKFREYLENQYARLSEMQEVVDGVHCEAIPMSRAEVTAVRRAYNSRKGA
jgi:hypothetical protein